jgi:3-oxoacyl-(acyl-carrier-protein) synthase
MRRVAVTGIGAISPLGSGAAMNFASARAGLSGVHRLEAPWSTRLQAPLAATCHFDGAVHFAGARLRMLDRVTQLALVATQQALDDAGCELGECDRGRVGVFVGTAMGGTQSTDDGYQTLYGERSDRIKPFSVLMGMYNAPAAWIGIEHDICGPNLSYGTGTPANDGIETAALKAVFGAHSGQLLISATKSMHGHLLGAAGALECALSLLAMQQHVALPTMHLTTADPACDLDYVANAAREGIAIGRMLSNSFAFGGTNVALVLGAAERP